MLFCEQNDIAAKIEEPAPIRTVFPRFSKPQNTGFVNLTTTPETIALRTRRLHPSPKILNGILLV
jgi:hypothetical protein